MDTVDGLIFAKMINNGFRDLKAHYESINELNVFPVPDGDTGTNIASTLSGGVENMQEEKENDLGKVSQALAEGMLLGARGNSGVILSQFFSGIADSFQGMKSANITQFAYALRSGTTKAYKAVVQPVEGTILTVARESVEYILKNLDDIVDFETFFTLLIKQMKVSLERTPDLLPVLKEAGVIDSGGAGLVYIMEGMGKEILGEELEDIAFNGPTNGVNKVSKAAFNENSVLTYGYCTEFILQLTNSKRGPERFNLHRLISFYSRIGDSIVALRQGNLVKVHVHTKVPYKVISYAQKYGEFITFKMENMSIQHNEIMLDSLKKEADKAIESEADKKLVNSKKVPLGIVSVSSSEQISSLFKELGVNEIITGGQTMNPSTKDFIEAFKLVNAETIIAFPNNFNIIMAANQAAKLYKAAKVIVLPTKSIVEAYSALTMADPVNQTLKENLEAMKDAVKNLTSASVCKSVRDTKNNGIRIKEGQFIGICKGAIVSCDSDLVTAVTKLLRKIKGIRDKEVFTMFYGKEATEKNREDLKAYVNEHYPLMEVVEIEGGQDVYPFLFAVE